MKRILGALLSVLCLAGTASLGTGCVVHEYDAEYEPVTVHRVAVRYEARPRRCLPGRYWNGYACVSPRNSSYGHHHHYNRWPH